MSWKADLTLALPFYLTLTLYHDQVDAAGRSQLVREASPSPNTDFEPEPSEPEP